jgi:hypothetical protein
MRANIANKYPNETMVILNKILPEDIPNDTSIGLIDILDISCVFHVFHLFFFRPNILKKFDN